LHFDGLVQGGLSVLIALKGLRLCLKNLLEKVRIFLVLRSDNDDEDGKDHKFGDGNQLNGTYSGYVVVALHMEC
jgi:hypothetical protein